MARRKRVCENVADCEFVQSHLVVSASNQSNEIATLRAENEALRQELAVAASSAKSEAVVADVSTANSDKMQELQRELSAANERVEQLQTEKQRLEGFLKTAKQMIRETRAKKVQSILIFVVCILIHCTLHS